MLQLPKQTEKLLTEFLKKNGTITDDAINQAGPIAEAMNSGVISALIDTGQIDEKTIADKFSESYGLNRSKVNLAELKNRPLSEKITDQFILINRVVPIDAVGDKVYVAVADPSALEAFNNMQVISDTNLVEASVVSLSEMQNYLDRLKTRVDDDFLRSLEAVERGEGSIDELILKQAGGDSKNHGIPEYLLEDQKEKEQKRVKLRAGNDVIEFVDNVISNAITLGVSDIHIESFRDQARVRYRKDGVLQVMEEYSEFLNFNYQATVTRIKILSSLDISERRLPQDGAIASELADKTVDVRVSILPTVHGERVVMRILDPDAANFTIDELGIPEPGLTRFKKAISAPQGLLLVTGPTGSGKSTTLYAGLKYINAPEMNIMTAEDPVEYDLSGVGQVQVKDNIGFSFASALRSFLRQDPEVIMVGEIRDKETGDIAIKASLTGHLVLSTLHTNDAPSTITRMINMGIPNYLITSSLSLVVAQRLARVNCPHCIEDDKDVRDDFLLDIGFKEEELSSVNPKISKGCDRCLDTGVKGRVGIHEILEMNQDLRDVILDNGSTSDITKTAKKHGFQTMQHVGRERIKEGKISVKEYKRVLVLD
jgi:type IV pilus assembly protein PilB